MTGFSTDQLTVSTADGRNFTLVEGFTFTRPNGEVITVAAGAQSDGASTPCAMWLTLPPFGSYWMPAFLHDDLYRRSDFDKEKCDTIFEEAMDFMKVGKIDETRLYEGVSHLGAISYIEDRKGDLTMWAKIAGFFKGFFGNVKADPMSTAKGLVTLAGAAGVGYLAATGAIPIPVAVSVAGPMAVSGIHSLGTNTSTGVTAPAAQDAIGAVQVVTAAAPVALSLVEQVKAMQVEAETAQGKVAAYAQIATTLAGMLPAVTVPASPVSEAAAAL